MKIYTRAGDRGETGLGDGSRVPKDDARVDAYGTVDELNSAIGVARAEGVTPSDDAGLARVQNELLELGSDLAHPGSDRSAALLVLGAAALEAWIDRLDAGLPKLTSFVLPGGCKSAAALHVARTTCRRAERLVCALQRTATVPPVFVVYLNRLSDLCFVLARDANRRAGRGDVVWEPRSE